MRVCLEDIYVFIPKCCSAVTHVPKIELSEYNGSRGLLTLRFPLEVVPKTYDVSMCVIEPTRELLGLELLDVAFTYLYATVYYTYRRDVVESLGLDVCETVRRGLTFRGYGIPTQCGDTLYVMFMNSKILFVLPSKHPILDTFLRSFRNVVNVESRCRTYRLFQYVGTLNKLFLKKLCRTLLKLEKCNSEICEEYAQV